MPDADLFGAWAPPTISAGVDEVGRGPLAGPVYAAAVVLGNTGVPEGVRDSKKLSARQRERLAEALAGCVQAYALGEASVEEIDRLNILRASHLAMERAVARLASVPALVLVDGNLLPKLTMPAVAVVRGDDRVPAIAAASIIAKVARDRAMARLAERHPGYGFERHAGYATAAHLTALQELGPCAAHRRSFAPVRRAAERHAALRPPAEAAELPLGPVAEHDPRRSLGRR